MIIEQKIFSAGVKQSKEMHVYGQDIFFTLSVFPTLMTYIFGEGTALLIFEIDYLVMDQPTVTVYETRNLEDNVCGVEDSQSNHFKDNMENVSSTDNELTALTTAHQAMKSLKDLIPCEYSREDILQSADELINSLNAKRKQDTELLADFKRTSELQVRRTCTLIEKQMFQVYEKQGKVIQEKIQELYAVLDRISKLETKIQECKRALQGLCHEFTV